VIQIKSRNNRIVIHYIYQINKDNLKTCSIKYLFFFFF